MSALKDFVTLAPNKNKDAVWEVYDALYVKYNEPHRYYHTIDHIKSGLNVQSELCSYKLTVPQFYAWMYHDVEYDPKAHDNEERSATYFLRDMKKLGFGYDVGDEVVKNIMLTTHTGEGNIITDMDLAGLGADWNTFDAVTNMIRREYAFVPEEVFRKGRVAILQQFLDRDPLYFTKEFAAAFTSQALANMNREVICLQSQQ